MKALFTDIDGTLSKGHASLNFVRELHSKGLFHDSHFREHEKSIEDYSQGKSTYMEWVETYLGIWAHGIKGQEKEEVEKVAGEYFLEFKKNIFPHAKELIEYCKEKGYYCVGVSSGLQEVVSLVGEYVDLAQVYGSKAEIKNGIYSGKMSSETHIEGGKGRIIDSLAEEKGINLKESAGFGDSIHDLEIFQKVGKVMVVNPSQELRELAEINNWVIAKPENALEKAHGLLE